MSLKQKPRLKKIGSEEEVESINYYSLGKIISAVEKETPETDYVYRLDVSRPGNNEAEYRFCFSKFQLMKYFVSKLSKANFRKQRMKIDHMDDPVGQ